MRKKSEIGGGGHTIFKLHSSKSHQPPLPHKKWTVPNNEKTLIECNPLQFYSLRSHLVDILEVTLTDWNKSIPDFNQDSPVIVTLFFKKKLEESQRKYIRIEESVDHDLPI